MCVCVCLCLCGAVRELSIYVCVCVYVFVFVWCCEGVHYYECHLQFHFAMNSGCMYLYTCTVSKVCNYVVGESICNYQLI